MTADPSGTSSAPAVDELGATASGVGASGVATSGAGASDIGTLPITILMNASSGSTDKSQAQAEIESVLKSAGRDVQLLVARRPRDLPMLAQRAADARPGILAAAGGDGTLNAVAAVAYARQLPFAVIPLGTFNYLARWLGIPEDSTAATRLIVGGHTRRIPVGCVNGRLFLNNASIGLYRRLIETRELHKRRFGRTRFVALLSGLVNLLSPYRHKRLRLEMDGQVLSLSPMTVFFGRNSLQMQHLGLDEALCVERGEMAVLALRPVGRFALLWLAVRGMFSHLETARELDQYCARAVRIERPGSKRRSMRVAVDGETFECNLPLMVEAIPDALQIIVPGPGTAAPDESTPDAPAPDAPAPDAPAPDAPAPKTIT